jgi:SAM-dependent methyltransferase
MPTPGTRGPSGLQSISFDQRGRAGLQFLGSLQYYSSSRLHDQAAEDFYGAPEAPALKREFAEDASPAAWEERLQRARAVAERSPSYRFNRFYQRFVAEENFVRGVPAIEAKRADWEAFVAANPPGHPERLQLDPTLEMPDWYEGVEWHLEPGGWDAYDLYMPMFLAGVGRYVFSRGGYAAVGVGADIRNQRKEVIQQFRRKEFRRVYEPGCGGTATLGTFRQLHPNTELIGGDLSEALLRNGHFMSELLGLDIHFRQENAEHVAEADQSVDGVIDYALHHEMPPAVSERVIAEMYRILTPGGEMVISDPPPFRGVDPLQGVILDWDTDHRAEPYFTAAGIFNLSEAMRKAGFVDVEEYGLEKNGYPWVTRGRKPA